MLDAGGIPSDQRSRIHLCDFPAVDTCSAGPSRASVAVPSDFASGGGDMGSKTLS